MCVCLCVCTCEWFSSHPFTLISPFVSFSLSLPLHSPSLPPFLPPSLPAGEVSDLNPADWAASVAQLAEHWTSNPVVTGLNPVRGSSVFFFTVCLRTLPHLPSLVLLAYTCTRLIMYMYMCTCNLHVHVHF